MSGAVAGEQFKSAVQGANEVDLIVTGRKSGRESSRPIWFVEEGDRVLLMPVGGRGANWYRNVVEHPEIRLEADGAELRAAAKPVEDSEGVADACERFGAKYGADRVKEYYPDQDAAVEVPLS
jgi:deazaflavin-dependent oxidoreductase (nitroreductase family)